MNDLLIRTSRGILSAALLITLAATSISCRKPVATVIPPPPKYAPSASPFAFVQQAAELPEDAGADRLRSGLISSVRERLMSHRDIERDMQRMVQEIAPIVDDAVRQPSAQTGLRQFAEDEGISVESARSQWTALQLADLMLESGGDPDALSSSAAAGAAQWLAGTARGVGLKVDSLQSDLLTAQITDLQCRIAWIRYLSRPDAERSAPGASQYAPVDRALLPSLTQDLERLREARRRVDARYDRRKAIFAQTRYLLRLYPKFPSPDWLFQAYHGGEAGASKTLRLYLGPAWPGATAAAIRSGDDGSPLTYDTLYFNTSPSSHREAFAYLYGRSDDHRRYWYKLLAAQQVLATYRKSPEAFHREWESSLPGRRIEAHWYPDAAAESILNLDSLRSRTDLVQVQGRPGLTVRPVRDDPANAPLYARLRPAAVGALILIQREFNRVGGKGVLETGDLTLTQEYVDRARLLHPPKPTIGPVFPPDPDADDCIGGGPPRKFDYHTTGLVFDLLRPKDSFERKTLEYAMDRLEARGLLSVIQAKDGGERRYHIVPHPAYGNVFSHLAAK